MSDDEADNNKNDLADIFGDDNIEDSDNDNDSIFEPSSKKSGGRLNKKSDSSLSRAEKALADTDDEEEGLKNDSADDNLSDDSGRGSSGKKKKKKGKALQKRKSRDNDASGDRDRKKKRKKKGRLTRSSDRGGDSNNKEGGGEKKAGGEGDDGDEYASDASGSADDDDKDFLASDDEFGDLVKEYDQDNTDFNDERPEQRKKNRVPSSSSSSSAKKKSNPTIYKKTDNADPMFDEFKKVKPKEMTEQELLDQAQAFVDKMDRARRADEIEVRASRPALKKIEILEEIAQHFCSVKLRPFLIKLGALKKLQEWIVPKQDTKELPSLTVRSKLYRVVLDLPYDADAIKGAKLGPLILFLSKHPRETVDNKKLLNSIVEKWSREMHGKQDSAYVSTASGATDELRHAAALQRIGSASLSGAAAAAKKSNSDSSAELEDIIASRVNQKDEKVRFYDPTYNGYVFTVKPDSMAPTDNVFKESEPKLMALARAKKVNTIKSHKYETVANGRDKL